jgi:YesN/AraC family two-component response regulator
MIAYIVKELLHYCNVNVKSVSTIESAPINYYDLTFVLKGEMTYIVNGKKHILEENDAVLIPPSAIRERVGSNQNVKYVSYNFTVNDGSELPSAVHLKGIISHDIRSLCQIFSASHVSDIYSTREKVINLLNYILLEINDAVQLESNNKHIIDIIKFINEHISEPITLSTVSESVNLAKEYVSHIFKKETGKTVTDYINERKMMIAKEMLLASHYKLPEIAERLGYDNYSYFSKLFKKQFGASPRAIRK